MGKLSKAELIKIKQKFIERYIPYQLTFYSEFDYDVLGDTILYFKKAGRGQNITYNDVIIMADTETSKQSVNTYRYEEKDIEGAVVKLKKYNPVPNHVVAWTISLRAFNRNIATLYGNTPEEFTDCLERLRECLKGDEIYIYWHNMSYDWCFIRRHMYVKFGHPERQLNTKSHYPIFIKFDNGIIFKDSLCLAQRKLEKWADDLNVEHKKAVEEWVDSEGVKHKKWDYDKLRSQRHVFTRHELDYIEHDTLAGVECIDATMKALNKHIYSMPYTATGIPREECRKLGKKHGARDSFLKVVLDYERYIQATRVYHGGYTHANRYVIERIIADVICRDFSSSYPYVMLSEKYPCEVFREFEDCSLNDIVDMSDNYAFMYKLILVGTKDNPVRLKDLGNPMPPLQFSKCVNIVNPILDNGRILQCDYAEIYLNEIDGKLILEHMKWHKHICTEVCYARKDYLPRWFTDYVYTLYSDKCTLKSGDPVLYAIAKAKLNSLYGMCVQKSLRDNLVEDYVTGEYKVEDIIKTDIPLIIKMPGFFIGFCFILVIKMRKSPFDLATSHHAHQEVIKGLTGDLSGPVYGFSELAELYEEVLMLGIVGLFFVTSDPLSLAGAAAAIIIVMFCMSLTDNIFPRVKWEGMLKAAWIVTFFAGGANLVVLSLLNR